MSEATPLEASMKEGLPLRVNEWGTNGMWLVCLVMALFALVTFWSAIRGNSGAFASAVAFLIFSLLCGRVAILGLVVEQSGVKVRTFWRNFRMAWSEIEDFELRGTVFRTSLLVRCVDGRVIGAQGLAARTQTEKQRAQRIWGELRERLAEQRN